jgi:hypothetical protein
VTRPKENLISENEGAVGRVGGVMMPLAPPASAGVTGGAVVGMTAVKVDAKVPTGAAVGGCGVGKTGFVVDCDKVPARRKSSVW